MWILFIILSSFSAWALEPFEQIKNVKILKALSNNVVMIDRGLEDGLERNDHIKFSSETEGYTSRAICLKSRATTSYWRIYRVPNEKAFSMDYAYTISGLADKEIPMPQAGWREKIEDFAVEAPKTNPKEDPFKVKRDLPEKLTERDLIETVGPEKRKLHMEQILDQDRLSRDLKAYKASFYASPFTRQSINEAESLRYGFRGGNVASKYRLMTQFEQQQTKLKDPVTKESISTRGTSGQAQFVIHHLTPSVSSLSLISYNSQRFSSVATPKSHWQVGPIGFTWHLYDSKSWEYIDLSYIPLYDTRTTDILRPDGSTKLDKTSGLRHGLRFAMKSRINERVWFENLLWVRPYQDLATKNIESDNLNLVNDLKLIFNMAGNFFFDYNLIYQKDKLWATLSNLPENNVINSINLRYDFDL